MFEKKEPRDSKVERAYLLTNAVWDASDQEQKELKRALRKERWHNKVARYALPRAIFDASIMTATTISAIEEFGQGSVTDGLANLTVAGMFSYFANKSYQEHLQSKLPDSTQEGEVLRVPAEWLEDPHDT